MIWINIEGNLPESDPSLINQELEDVLMTKKLIVLTDSGRVEDNYRVKMQAGAKEWRWMRTIECEKVTHWTIFEEPSDFNTIGNQYRK